MIDCPIRLNLFKRPSSRPSLHFRNRRLVFELLPVRRFPMQALRLDLYIIYFHLSNRVAFLSRRTVALSPETHWLLLSLEHQLWILGFAFTN